MKKTSGATPRPVGSPPTAPPTPAAPAAPSTPSGLSSLQPGDARHMISAIRRSSGRSSGNQRELQLPNASSASPLAGRDTTRRGGRVGQGDHADNEEEEEDNGPADEPAFPEVQRLLYRAADLLSSSPAAPSRPPAQGPQHQTPGAQDQTAAATSGQMPTPPRASHSPAPNPPAPQPPAPSAPAPSAPSAFAPSAPARLPKIVIRGSRAGLAANTRPAAAENQPSPGKETVPSGDGEAVAAAGEERAAAAQGPNRPTKIKFVSRAQTSLAPPRAGSGNSVAGDEEEEEEEKKGGAAGNATTTSAPKPKRKPRAKKGAPLPAGPPAISPPPAASSGPPGEAPKPPGRKPRANKPSAAAAGPSTSAPEHPPNNRGPPLPAAPTEGGEALFDVVGGLASGAFVQPNQGGNIGPSRGSSDQSSLDYRLAEPDEGTPSDDLPEYPHQADPGPEQRNAAPIDPALSAPIPFPDPIAGIFPTVPVCFEGSTPMGPTGLLWYPFNFQGEIDPHWESWPIRPNYPLIPGTGTCDPSDLHFEPHSSLPQALHNNILDLAHDGLLFTRILESVNWANEALDNCGYDFERDPLHVRLPRAVRAALAGYRPFVFPRSGLNPFVGAGVPDDAAAADADGPLLEGGVEMEYADPADASTLGDGVVVGPALPRTIRNGSVFSRAENALLIPVEWRERNMLRNGMEMGLGGAPAGDGLHGGPAADAPYFIADMPLDGPAYIDQPIDLEDDLYDDSQAGDIAAERRDLEPEEDTAIEERPTYPGAATQPTINADQTGVAATGINEGFNERMAFEAGPYTNPGGNPEHDLYTNNQAGNNMEDQQASWPNPNTAIDVENPIYPGALPQLPTITDRNRDLENNLYGNGQSGNITTGQQGLEPMDNTGMYAEHPIFPGAGPQPATGRNDGNNGSGFVAGEDGDAYLRGPDENTALAQAFDLTQAGMDAIVPGGPNLAVPAYHANNLPVNEQLAALNINPHVQNDQGAIIENQPVIWDERFAGYNQDLLDLDAPGHPMGLHEQSAIYNHNFLDLDAQGRPVGLVEQSAANNFHSQNNQTARIEDFFHSNNQIAAPEGPPGTWNNDFVMSNDQAANHQGTVMESQPATVGYNLLGFNQGAVIENRPQPAHFHEPQPAYLHEHALASEDRRGVAWPDFDEDEVEAQMEALRLGFGGDPASKRARE